MATPTDNPSDSASEPGQAREGHVSPDTPAETVPGHEAEPGVDEKRPEDDTEEVAHLRAEVSALRDQLATRERRGVQVHVVRRVVAAILVAVAAFGAVGSVIGVWGAYTALNTDRWVAIVGPLPANQQVDAAVATYVTGEVFKVLDVQGRVTAALPPEATFVAAPLTGAVRGYVLDTVEDLLRTPQFQSLWVRANQAAHERVVAILENRSPGVSVEGQVVTLNLLPLINDVLVALEQRLPTLFGKQLNLPTISSGTIPPNLRARVESALGVTLPANFGQITLYRGDELRTLQDALVTFKRSVALLVIGSLLTLGLALWVSPGRRRTTLQLGLWLAVAVVVLSSIVRAVRAQLLDQVPEGVYREGVQTGLQIVFATLRQRGDQLLWLGLALAVVCYLAGPGRGAVAVRRLVTRGGRAVARVTHRVTHHAASGRSSAWLRRHLDAFRVGGLVVAAVVALLLSSWSGLLVLLLILVGYEVAVTLLARAGAGPQAGEGPPTVPPAAQGPGDVPVPRPR